MISLSLLCAALLLTSIAVLLQEQERRRVEGAVALLENEHEIALEVRRSDVSALFSGLWPLDQAIERAFWARYGNGPRRGNRRRRQYVVAHVLGVCGRGCSACRTSTLWTDLARRAGRLDRWVEMARRAGDPRVTFNMRSD